MDSYHIMLKIVSYLKGILYEIAKHFTTRSANLFYIRPLHRPLPLRALTSFQPLYELDTCIKTT